MEKNSESSLALMVLIMETFEDYISYIEDELGVQLLTWQKEALYYYCKHPYAYIYVPKASGRTILKRAIKLLDEKEN